MSQTVQRGPFIFKTFAQLNAIKAEFANRTPSYDQALTGASINGQSYQFGEATYTAEEFGTLLQDAFCQVGHTEFGYPSGRTSTARLC